MTVNKVFNSLTLTVRRATIYISVQCALALGIASFTDKIIKIRLRVSKGEIVSCKMVCYTFVSLNCQKSNFKVRIYVNENLRDLVTNPFPKSQFFVCVNSKLCNPIPDDWLNLNTRCSAPFCIANLKILPVRGTTAAASDVGVMSDMHDLGT